MNPYMNCWATVMNIVKRFNEANPGYELTPMDFDNNVLEQEYPEGNLTGIYQMEYSESGSLIYVQCAFPVSVNSDTDATVLNEIAGKLGAFVRSETRHPFYDYASGAAIGLMVARDELGISPMMKTTNRQFKFVAQGFIVDRTSTFQVT